MVWKGCEKVGIRQSALMDHFSVKVKCNISTRIPTGLVKQKCATRYWTVWAVLVIVFRHVISVWRGDDFREKCNLTRSVWEWVCFWFSHFVVFWIWHNADLKLWSSLEIAFMNLKSFLNTPKGQTYLVTSKSCLTMGIIQRCVFVRPDICHLRSISNIFARSISFLN